MHRGAEPVVDVDHRHARRAGVQHGQQRSQPAEAGAVAHAGRHGYHGTCHQPAEHAGERALHPGSRDDDLRLAQHVQPVHQPVDAGHADVIHALYAVAKKLQRERGLFSHRNVAGAGRDHRDEGRVRGARRRGGHFPER